MINLPHSQVPFPEACPEMPGLVASWPSSFQLRGLFEPPTVSTVILLSPLVTTATGPESCADPQHGCLSSVLPSLLLFLGSCTSLGPAHVTPPGLLCLLHPPSVSLSWHCGWPRVMIFCVLPLPLEASGPWESALPAGAKEIPLSQHCRSVPPYALPFCPVNSLSQS